MILNRARSISDSESDSKPLRTTHPPDLGGQNGPIIARVQKCVYSVTILVSNPPNLICPWGSGRVVKPPEARRYCSLDRLQTRSVILCSSSSISVCVYLAPTVTSGHRALSSSMIVFYSFNWTSHAVIFETPICPLEKRTGLTWNNESDNALARCTFSVSPYPI